MPIRGAEIFAMLRPLLLDGRDYLGDGVQWFDAHTHMGHNDPDGTAGTAEEVVAALDDAGHQRALIFAMHEPAGYPPANDAVFAATAASGGRLLPLARLDPNADALTEARRCIDAGTRGFKLHPRSDEFQLPHPVVEEIVALAAEHRMPVLFHAGRGIPHLGEAAADLARRYPEARLILAHAGISDLGHIVPAARELPNLFFDTSWWQIADLLTLYTTIPPGRIVYGSDMPYAPGLAAACFFARAGRSAGLSPEQMRVIAGEQLDRIVTGQDPIDLGPAPGPAGLGPRNLACERVLAYAVAAVQLAFRDVDPSEALALARLGCQTYSGQDGDVELLRAIDQLLELAQQLSARYPDMPRAIMPPTAGAMILAGTPALGAPRALLV
jgi:predicted TIM-barrel fold metal-dependent hydrolase